MKVHVFQQINNKGVEIRMLAQWIADVVGQMHKYRISMKALADHMGISREYVSMVLNGHREPADAEDRFRKAVEELVASANAE